MTRFMKVAIAVGLCVGVALIFTQITYPLVGKESDFYEIGRVIYIAWGVGILSGVVLIWLFSPPSRMRTEADIRYRLKQLNEAVECLMNSPEPEKTFRTRMTMYALIDELECILNDP